MNEYIFSADLLNKYSQLTPWVQAFIILTLSVMIIFIAYFIKEYISLLTKPFCNKKPTDEKTEWKDKYYRDGKEH